MSMLRHRIFKTICSFLFILFLFPSFPSLSLAAEKKDPEETEKTIYGQAFKETKGYFDSAKEKFDAVEGALSDFKDAVETWRNATTKEAQEEGIEGIDNLMNGLNENALNALIEKMFGEGAVKKLDELEKVTGLKLSDKINLWEMYKGSREQKEKQLKNAFGYMYDLSSIERHLREKGVFEKLEKAKKAFKLGEEKLKAAGDMVEFVKLFDPNSVDENDPTGSLKKMKEVLVYAKQFTDKIPALGHLIDFYAEATDVFIGALDRLDKKLKEARQGALCGQFGVDKQIQSAFEKDCVGCDCLTFLSINAEYPLLSPVRGWQGVEKPDVFLYMDETHHVLLGGGNFAIIYKYYSALKSSGSGSNKKLVSSERFMTRAMAITGDGISGHDEKFKQYYDTFEGDKGPNFRKVLEVAGALKDFKIVSPDGKGEYKLGSGQADEFRALCFFSDGFRKKVEELNNKYGNHIYIYGEVEPKEKKDKITKLELWIDHEVVRTIQCTPGKCKYEYHVEKDWEFKIWVHAKGFKDAYKKHKVGSELANVIPTIYLESSNCKDLLDLCNDFKKKMEDVEAKVVDAGMKTSTPAPLKADLEDFRTRATPVIDKLLGFSAEFSSRPALLEAYTKLSGSLKNMDEALNAHGSGIAFLDETIAAYLADLKVKGEECLKDCALCDEDSAGKDPGKQQQVDAAAAFEKVRDCIFKKYTLNANIDDIIEFLKRREKLIEKFLKAKAEGEEALKNAEDLLKEGKKEGTKPDDGKADTDKKPEPAVQVQPDSYIKGFGSQDLKDLPPEGQGQPPSSDETTSAKAPVQTPDDGKTGTIPGPKDETEIKGDTEGKAGAGDDKKTADADKQFDDKKSAEDKADDKKTDVKEPPACSYEYTEWGECGRETKKQTRSVASTKPEGCVEKDKPALEQGCTPPPTEEEKRLAFLSCLCRSCGGSMGGYYNTGDSCDNARPCACWGVFNCWSTPIPAGDDLVKSCYASAYGIKEPGKDELNNALTAVKEENRQHMKPLKAKLNRADCPIHAQLGDVLNFSLSFEGGLPPHTVSWSGEGEAKDNTFIFAKSRQPGSHTISATVNDSDGNTVSVSCTVVVDAITVKIEKTSPAENTLPIGSQASFKAIVMSGSGQAGGELKFLWQPHPEVQFGDDKSPQFETTSPNTTATYTRIGTFPMWVQVLKKMGETYQTVGESDQILMTIAKPKFKLTADNKAPKVGETVVITVHEEPKMSDDIIGFWWELEGNAENPGPAANIPNSRAYSFKPKDTKPVTVTVHAKTKDGKNDLGEEKATITVKSYSVTVTGPKSAGPKPQIWKEGLGLVDVDKEIAVHQRVEFSAEVSPKPETDLRYNWTVSGGSCTLSNPIVKDVGVTCNETGSYEITVTVRDKDNIDLGKKAAAFSVSISQNELDKASAKAKPKVSLKADKSVLTVGETANVTASVDGGSQPYSYKWTGDFEGQGKSVRFGPKKPGSHTLSIEIADAKGNKDSANITFKVEAIKVTIEGLQNEVVYGAKLNLGAKPENRLIAWKSEPAITFTPGQGIGGKTAASFGSIGKVKIWAVAQQKTGEIIGESDKKEINVIAPKFEITFTPPKGKVGEEVKATIKTTPPIDKSLLKFVWISPQPQNIKTYDTNIIGFTPKSTVPVEFLAIAKEPVKNGTLAEITGRYTAETVKLDVSLKADKARLKIGGTANIRATVKGGKTPYTFSWKGDYTGDGTSVRFIAGESGPQKLSVEVTDAMGNKGSADISIDVEKATAAKAADAKSTGAKSTDAKSADKGPVKTAPLPESFTTPKTSDSPSSGYDLTKDPSFKAGKKPTGVAEVYDPTKDPNVKGSGKQVDIAAVDKLGKEFEDASGKTKKSSGKKADSQVIAQPDIYTGSGSKKPDEGEAEKSSQRFYPPHGPDDAMGSAGKDWTDLASGKPTGGKEWSGGKTSGKDMGGPTTSTTKSTTSSTTSSSSTGSTSSTTKTTPSPSSGLLTAVYENKTDAAVHIFAEGENFSPSNRLAPGEKRTVSLTMPPDGRIKFISGRNGQIISTRYWNGDPGDLNRYPMVRFVKGMGGKEELSITTNLK